MAGKTNAAGAGGTAGKSGAAGASTGAGAAGASGGAGAGGTGGGAGAGGAPATPVFGAPELVADGVNRLLSLAIDDTNVYLGVKSDAAICALNGSVLRVAKTGGAVDTIGSQITPCGDFAVDATHIYYSDGNKVKRASKP